MTPFQQPLGRLLHQLAILKGLLGVTDHQLEAVKRQMRRALDGGGPGAFLHSNRTFFFDVTAPDEDRNRMEFVTPTFVAADAEAIASIEEKQQRERASTAAQMFEAFETFVKDIAALYFHAHPDQASQGDVNNFERLGRHDGLPKTDTAYWRRLVRSQMGGPDRILNVLRNRVPCIDAAERTNHNNWDMKDWMLAAYEVRHAATHADYEFKQDRYDRLTETQLVLLLQRFPWREVNGMRRFVLTQIHVERAVQGFSEYALLIFKCMVSAEGLAWKTEAKEVIPAA